jgi:dTDP-4-amino-4,6-dideoxygalactose transaminase
MSWRIPMVDLAAEYAEVGKAVEEAVLRVLRSGRYALGPETAAFEEEFADFIGARHAVGVGSGTEALTLALRAAGVKAGDEVVTTAFTYFATVEAILIAGARPVFVDVEPETFNLDPAQLEAALSPRTRAVVPVHLFGRCADLARIAAITEARGIAVVEDAAQATGAAVGGRRAGAWGQAGCFSFYPSKVLGAAGDGGCIVTDDTEMAERLRLLRTHGWSRGAHVLAGTSSRLDSIQAAVLRVKLPYLEGWIAGRAQNASVYADALGDCPGVTLPAVAAAADVHAWNQYTIRCESPEPVRRALAAAGVECRHYYPTPASSEPGLAGARCPPGSFPGAERACAAAISLPIRSSCTASAIREIAGLIRGALAA